MEQQMQEARGQAREKVEEARGQVRSRAREQIDQRSTQAGERVVTMAGDARSVGEELRKQGKDGPARLADQAAERAERFGGYLKDADADRMLNDVEDFGRRKPMAVAAGGLLLGFVASRFLKASSRDRYQASRGLAQDGWRTSQHGERTGTIGAPGTLGTAGSPAGATGGGDVPPRS